MIVIEPRITVIIHSGCQEGHHVTVPRFRIFFAVVVKYMTQLVSEHCGP